MALRWLRDCLFEGDSGFDVVCELAEKVPAGCEGLIALPFFSGCADPVSLPDYRAAFVGAGLSTKKEHFVRAVMEGVGYLLLDLLRGMEPYGVRADGIVS